MVTGDDNSNTHTTATKYKRLSPALEWCVHRKDEQKEFRERVRNHLAALINGTNESVRK